MKRYAGKPEGHPVEVTVDDRALNPRLDLWNHSPGGFEWGYGPAQLALAPLANRLGNNDRAVSLHQDFKSQSVANLTYRGWILTSYQIQSALAELKARAPASILEDFER